MSGDFLEKYTYEYLMELALSYVSDDKDKREGSVVYDCLAPFCQLLAAGAMLLRNFYTQTYAPTATGEDLDNRVLEQGVIRYPATQAIKKITLADANGNPVVAPIGSRFSTMSDTNPINYSITSEYEEDGVVVPGSYEATCEEYGAVGNEYYGNLINITFIQGLASATMSAILTPARNEETDDELRERYFQTVNQKAFGGNIADYKANVLNIPGGGVGAVQVYPTWNGGGTVKLSIVDPSYNPCSQEFISSVQQIVDPENAQGVKGTGLGIAPIGHNVTIVTPDEVTIDISANITLQNGYNIGQIEPSVVTALADYIQSLKESWADANDLNVYTCDIFVARVTATIVGVTGIANVTEVKLNGESKDIMLIQSGELQQLPKLGEVTLNV